MADAILAAVIGPCGGMDAVHTAERVVREHDVRLIRMVPFLINKPPNDMVYYPVYAKCIELGVAVSVNTCMNTRGQAKVLFATDFPFLPFDRAVQSACALPFRPEVLEQYLGDNARRVFGF